MFSNFHPIYKSNNPWVLEHFNVKLPDADWNGHIWPTHESPFVFIDKGRVQCDLGKFGIEFISTRTMPMFRHKTYNAKSETLETKKFFRSAWQERRFGLILVEQFYEPTDSEDIEDHRWKSFRRIDGEPIALAAIWDSYYNWKTNQLVRSFSMLTVGIETPRSDRQLYEFNKESRSVVVIENKNFNTWLNASHEQAKDLIKPPPAGYLQEII